ncbi:MAG TPA: hypothetical protein VG097_17465 [Gemmata sp.]|jgi:transketolase|nr:hypothetical protein [Gemmata sp.]
MIRGVVVMACLLGIISVADGDDNDAVKEKLFAAKKSYDTEMSKFRSKVGAWLDKREDVESKAGNKKNVDEVLAWRKAFEHDSDLPIKLPDDILDMRKKAGKTLETAYDKAIKEYTRQRMRDEAAAVEKEWKEFEKTLGDRPFDKPIKGLGKIHK